MAFNPQEYVKYQNVPKPKPLNIYPQKGDVPNPGNPAQLAQLGGIDWAGGGVQAAPPVAAGPALLKPGVAARPGFWTTPDYKSMLPTDWEVTGAEAAGNKAQSEAEAQFQKALRTAFIDYGGDVSKLGDFARYIDQPTIEAARANKYSNAAQTLQAYNRSLSLARSKLAARGMSTSGAQALQTNSILGEREKSEYAALRDYLGGGEQQLQKLAELRQQIADKIAAANSAAAARLAAEHPAYYTDPVEGEDAVYAGQPAPLDYSHYTSPAAQAGLDAEQAYYVSRALPIPKPKPPPKPPPMSFANLVGGQYTPPKKKK